MARKYFHARISNGTGTKLSAIALELGYVYQNRPSPGMLLDAIASGKYHLWDSELGQFVYTGNI